MKKNFTQITNAAVRSGRKITDAEFRLYSVLLSFAFNKEFVFPSRETLSIHMGASLAKVDRVKKSLEKKGAFRKQRRGQGITNLYFLNREFLYQAEDSNMSPLGYSPMSGKEDEVDNTFNNYLPTSKTFRDTNLGEKPNLSSGTQPKENNQPYKEKAVGITTELGSVSQPKQKDPRIIFLNLLNRVKREFDDYLSKLSPERLQDEEWSLNTASCVKGIQYYLRKYKSVFGEEHVPIKLAQLKRCFINFNCSVSELEEVSLPPSKIDEVLQRAIDRWFTTTSLEPNNLNLNHFAGINNAGELSLILDNSVYEVMDELGYWRKEEASADS